MRTTNSPHIDHGGSEELAILHERLKTTLLLLKESPTRTYADALQFLPWYLLLGASGAGKSSLIKHSALSFPLTNNFFSQPTINGHKETAYCDFWVSAEAVLVDMAGRYTQQEHNSQAHSIWLAFLDLLCRYRRPQAIHGVLLTVSAKQLLQSKNSELILHAQRLRQCLEELKTHLMLDFPVYIIVTQCDLLAGFCEFHHELDMVARQQVWGFSFKYPPESAEAVAKAFNTEFCLLVEQLYQQLNYKILLDKSVEQQRLLCLFPKQFSLLQSSLLLFLQQLNQTDLISTEKINFRGVYFTSALQEGSPINTLMLNVMGKYNISTPSAQSVTQESKSYFIQQLFQQLILPEVGLASFNRKTQRRLQQMQAASLTAIWLVGLLLLSFMIVAYRYNAQALDYYASLEPNSIKLRQDASGSTPDVVVKPLSLSSPASQTIANSLGFRQAEQVGQVLEQRWLGMVRRSIDPPNVESSGPK